jgi:large subunit ribosomal protein L17
MHRHGYQGRKFGRETDQRRALMKSLAEALVLRESIETTLPKAKEVKIYVEKLITKAKKGDLHNRRQVIAALQTVGAAHKLVDEIAPKLTTRTSGHLTIKRSTSRRGDNAQLAVIKFVDDLSKEPAKKAETKTVKPAKVSRPAKPATKKPTAKPTTQTRKKAEVAK